MLAAIPAALTTACASTVYGRRGVPLGQVLIGAGKQAVTVPLLVVAYWVLGLPLGAVAAFVPPLSAGLLGIWWGMTLGVALHLAFYLLLVYCPCLPGAIRWEVAAKEAAARIATVGNEEGAATADEAPIVKRPRGASSCC